MIQQSHSWACNWTKLSFRKIHVSQCSQQHYSQQPRHGSNINVHQQEEWIKTTWPIYSMEYLRSCLLAQSCLTLSDPMDGSHQAPLSMGFFRHEYWRGLAFPLPGDLPDPGIELVSLTPTALAGGVFFFTTSAKWVKRSFVSLNGAKRSLIFL